MMRIHQCLDGVEHDFSGCKPQLVELVHFLLRLKKDAQNTERCTLRAKNGGNLTEVVLAGLVR